MWAEQFTWPWFVFDSARMGAAILLIINFFAGLFLAKFVIALLVLFMLLGLFARVPWKRWFGSRDDGY